jgi:hypothetical protein
MAIERRWIVSASAARLRLDRFLALEMPGYTRSQIQAWIRNGQVLLNGIRSKTGQLLRTGDEVIVCEPSTAPDLPQPEPIPLQVLYEDEDIAVIDKPAGLVCHAGAGRRSGTLVNAILHRWGRVETGDPMRPGIVHRLDRQTSGDISSRTGRSERNTSRSSTGRSRRHRELSMRPSGGIPLIVRRSRFGHGDAAPQSRSTVCRNISVPARCSVCNPRQGGPTRSACTSPRSDTQ